MEIIILPVILISFSLIFIIDTGTVLLNIVLRIVAAIPIFFIAWFFHPISIIFGTYLVAGLLQLLAPKHWSRRRIWTKSSSFSILVTLAFYIALGIMAPFIHVQCRARQSEAKTNLASIATAEIAYFAEIGNFSDNFAIIGWSPQGNTKYSYYLSQSLIPEVSYLPATSSLNMKKKAAKITFYHEIFCAYEPSNITLHFNNRKDFSHEKEVFDSTVSQYGIGVTVSGFTAMAIGNIDSDPDLDVWLITEKKDPMHVHNDVAEGDNKDKIFDIGFLVVYTDAIILYLNGFSILLLFLNGIILFVFFITDES